MRHFYVHNNHNGKIEVSQNCFDWREVTKDELTNTLQYLKQDKENAIIYSRENSQTEATNQDMEIFRIVESSKLPLKLVKRKGSDGTGESEPNNEPSYVNCLLVTLAKSPGSIAIIKSMQSVPDIALISKNNDELPWIRGLPFNYNQIKADTVIDIIMSIPSKKISLFGNDRELIAKMALSEGKSETVRFLIKQSKSISGSRQLELSRTII